MVSKVEELRDRLMEPVETWIASIEGEWSVDLTHEKVDFESVLGSLISAAYAEGVAEGTEQERERIRFYSEAIYNTHLGITAVKQWVVPDNILDPSVLAPAKEPDRGNI